MSDVRDTTLPAGEQAIRLALLLMPTFAYATIWLSLEPGAPGQMHACRLATVLLLGVALAGARSSLRAADSTVRWAVVLAVLVIVQGVGWLAAVDVDEQRDLAQLLGALVLVDILLLVGRSAARLWSLIVGVAVGAVVVLVVAGVEYSSGRALEERVGRPWPFGDALAATFTNPNSLAAHSAAFLGVFLALAVTRRRYRALCLLLVAVCMPVALLTLSRTAVFSIVACLVVLLVSSSGGRMARLAPRLILLSLLGVLVWLLFGQAFDAYYASISGGAGESDAARGLMLERALGAMASQAGVGMGPGRFEASVSGTYSDMRGISNIHNSFVEVGVAYGLVPALILIAVLVRSIVTCARHCARDQLLGIAGMACGVSVVLGALVASSILGDPAWWVSLAVCILCAQTLARTANDA